MDKKTFLEQVEKYRALAIGNYKEIAKLGGIDRQELTYAMAGRTKTEDFYAQCYSAIETFCNKAIENINHERTQSEVKVA